MINIQYTVFTYIFISVVRYNKLMENKICTIRVLYLLKFFGFFVLKRNEVIIRRRKKKQTSVKRNIYECTAKKVLVDKCAFNFKTSFRFIS